MVQNCSLVYCQSTERLSAIFDAGTFVELGAYTKRKTAPEETEGVVCGYGAVNGKLVFAFAQDNARNKGAFGERHAKKICDLYSLAIKNGAPVIGLFDSIGAVVYDGVSALASYAKFMKCVSAASGVIPQIAVVNGMCAGSSAVIASMFDFTVSIKGTSKFYVNVPFVVGDELNDSEFSAKNGTAAFCADDEAEAFSFVKRLVEILPSNNAEGAFCGYVEDDVNRTVDLILESYSADDIITKIADNGQVLKVYGEYSDSISAGFVSFGGVVACVIASEPSKNGVIDIKAARVYAKLLNFCDSFNIAVVNLIDSVGVEESVRSEYEAYSSELAGLASAYATSTAPKISVVLGKAYGAAFALLGSKSLGADLVYALPQSCISVLSPEASVAFVWNSKVGEKSREELELEWKEKCASSAEACELGEVDDIIEATELRKRICSALSMLAYKSDAVPSRKHINLPL